MCMVDASTLVVDTNTHCTNSLYTVSKNYSGNHSSEAVSVRVSDQGEGECQGCGGRDGAKADGTLRGPS
jgi:hypothetical protein